VSGIALVYQPAVDDAVSLASSCAEVAARRGFEPQLLSTLELDKAPSCPAGSIVVTFGGDGTILRAARWVAGREIPIVGVQMGRLGFLAELQPPDAVAGLEPYLDGDYWLDRRAMLATTVLDSRAEENSAKVPMFALNDIVVGRGATIRTVSVDISLADQVLHEFRCDGVIVASATGSTAYSFACGGPVLPPESRERVITPISPHLSTLKSFVIPDDTPIQLTVTSLEDATLTVDGQVDRALGSKGTVETRVAEVTTVFARRGTTVELYRRILAKLG
jgi:NAD+ kinase